MSFSARNGGASVVVFENGNFINSNTYREGEGGVAAAAGGKIIFS